MTEDDWLHIVHILELLHDAIITHSWAEKERKTVEAQEYAKRRAKLA